MAVSIGTIIGWFWEARIEGISFIKLQATTDSWKIWLVGAIVISYLLIRFWMSSVRIEHSTSLQKQLTSAYRIATLDAFRQTHLDRLHDTALSLFFSKGPTNTYIPLPARAAYWRPTNGVRKFKPYHAREISEVEYKMSEEVGPWMVSATIKYKDPYREEETHDIRGDVHTLGKILIKTKILWRNPAITFVRLEVYIPIWLGLIAFGLCTYKFITGLN
jgi:hypothetical protein